MTAAEKRALAASQRLAKLLPAFEKRAEEHDRNDSFIAENYRALKKARLMSIAVPAELGGIGLSVRQQSGVLRVLAGACASTALAYSMHTQSVASLAWHWRHHNAPVTSILRRIAREQLAVATTNGADWLSGSGEAVAVNHGFRISALKRIVSAARGSDLLATNAILQDPISGPTVLHFIVPMKERGVSVQSSWQASGMRGTGSDNVRIRDLLVGDRTIIARRPAGRWHPLYHTAVMLALPLIMSVYVGIAETARNAALASARKKPLTETLINQAGALEGHLKAARMALDDMLNAGTDAPDIHSTSDILMARTLAGDACRATVEAAVQIAGASAFMRASPLERLFRDVQAARFHPLEPNAQRQLAGRLALGLDADAV